MDIYDVVIRKNISHKLAKCWNSNTTFYEIANANDDIIGYMYYTIHDVNLDKTCNIINKQPFFCYYLHI